MYRQKKYICNDFLDIEITQKRKYQKTINRAKKYKESTPSQKRHNKKKQERYISRLVNLNFTENDLIIDLTFDEKNLPKNIEEAKKDIRNYIKRIKYFLKKQNENPAKFKYIYTISEIDFERTAKKRIHIHMIMSNIDRDVAEKLWKSGRSNSKRIQYDEYGIAGRAIYMIRQGREERAWNSSTNLIKPEPIVSDKAVSRAEFDHITNAPDDRLFFEKKYKGWTFTDCEICECEEFNTTLCIIRMRKVRKE